MSLGLESTLDQLNRKYVHGELSFEPVLFL